MIRPYQRCIIQERISGIKFNDKDPHREEGGKYRYGTAEKIRGAYNSIHYIEKETNKAHSMYLAKLASKIDKESESEAILRLAGIYNAIYIDEVQDLVGYDFDVINAIFKSGCEEFFCVGDLRQTVYETSIGKKKPKTNDEKIDAFKKIGFRTEHMNISRRCVQSICDFSNLLHEDKNCYPATVSEAKAKEEKHHGVFVVTSDTIDSYIELYDPVILRESRRTKVEPCKSNRIFNFGEVKGCGFDRILICPTKKHKAFLFGDLAIFNKDKTDIAKNKFYVAITRAKYSVAFYYKELNYNENNLIDGVDIWIPN